MSDDIVNRLREQAQKDTPFMPRTHLSEAADEIERLRADRDRWRWHANDLYRALHRALLLQRAFTFDTATAESAEARYLTAIADEHREA